MTFSQVFIQEVEEQYTGSVPFVFNTDTARAIPFIAAIIIPPNDELPSTFGAYGDGGTVSIQFSLADRSPQVAYNALEELKVIVQKIRASIGTAPDSFYIDSNETSGVVPFDQSLGTWSAVFTSRLAWTRI